MTAIKEFKITLGPLESRELFVNFRSFQIYNLTAPITIRIGDGDTTDVSNNINIDTVTENKRILISRKTTLGENLSFILVLSDGVIQNQDVSFNVHRNLENQKQRNLLINGISKETGFMATLYNAEYQSAPDSGSNSILEDATELYYSDVDFTMSDVLMTIIITPNENGFFTDGSFFDIRAPIKKNGIIAGHDIYRVIDDINNNTPIKYIQRHGFFDPSGTYIKLINEVYLAAITGTNLIFTMDLFLTWTQQHVIPPIEPPPGT